MSVAKTMLKCVGLPGDSADKELAEPYFDSACFISHINLTSPSQYRVSHLLSADKETLIANRLGTWRPGPPTLTSLAYRQITSTLLRVHDLDNPQNGTAIFANTAPTAKLPLLLGLHNSKDSQHGFPACNGGS